MTFSGQTEFPSLQYWSAVQSVLITGEDVGSRYGLTREVVPAYFSCKPGTLVRRKKLSWALGFMELYQLIAGVFKPAYIQAVAPKANMDLFTYPMSYGPRVVNQISELVKVLRNNPSTRQAVLFVGKPEDGPTSNQPCTTCIQFLSRGGELHAVVQMRSWDFLYGLPYDLVMFGGLTMALARCLGVRPGALHVRAGSGHVYTEKLKGHEPLEGVDYFEFTADFPYEWEDMVRFTGEKIRRTHEWVTGAIPPGIVVLPDEIFSKIEG